jgi:hypothetical protein
MGDAKKTVDILVRKDCLGDIRVVQFSVECNSSLPNVDYLERERGIIGFLMVFCSLA